MNCRKRYKDMEKYRKYRNGCNKRYYQKTENAENGKQKWSEDEVEMIMEKRKTDTELAYILGRSVKAIQIKRNREKALQHYCNLIADRKIVEKIVEMYEDSMADWEREMPELIRCKDCKHWCKALIQCSKFTVNGVAHCTSPEWFCADGKRNDE
jgi:hypothetical protein